MKRLIKGNRCLSKKAIERKIKMAAGEFWLMRRWMIISCALYSPVTTGEIAQIFGVAQQTVNNLLSAYKRYGVKAIETNGKGQRQRAIMSLAEEKEFITQMKRKVNAGWIVTTNEVHLELERRLGTTVHKSTVYRMLRRNNWETVIYKPLPPS